MRPGRLRTLTRFFLQDARNVARILVELGKLEVRLEPNTVIHPVRLQFYCGGGDVATAEMHTFPRPNFSSELTVSVAQALALDGPRRPSTF